MLFFEPNVRIFTLFCAKVGKSLHFFENTEEFLDGCLGFRLAIRCMEKLDDVDGALFHDVPFMAKSLESVKSVIVPDTAVANPSKGNRKVLYLDDAIVDACGAGCRLCDDGTDCLWGFSENVQGKRFGVVLDVMYGIFQGIVG